MKIDIPRRQFWPVSLQQQPPQSQFSFAQESAPQDGIQWRDVKEWGIEGQGWHSDQMENFFDCLPARAKGVVRRGVESKSTFCWHAHPVPDECFGDLDRPRVTSSNLAAAYAGHGVSGIDLYASTREGHSRWLAVTRPNSTRTKTKLVSNLSAGQREFTAYLPLYNGTKSLKFGVPEGTRSNRSHLESKLLYSMELNHARCLRSGRVCRTRQYFGDDSDTRLLTGFQNGRMEPQVGQFLCELDPLIYVIDCLPNMIGREVAERAEKLVLQLREALPDTPILLVEDRTYAHSPFIPSLQRRHHDSRSALKAAFASLVANGQDKISYLDGDELLGEDETIPRMVLTQTT